MILRSLFLKVQAFVRYKIEIKDKFWYNKCKWYGIPFEDLSWDTGSQKVVLELFQFSLTNKNQEFLLDGYAYLKEIKRVYDISLYSDEENKVYIRFEDFIFWIETKQEILIIKEVFADFIYGYKIAEKSLVIDVGFNVGISGIFFASNRNVINVYGLEPFQPTMEKAYVNLSLNSNYAKKIKVFGFGLSDEERDLEIKYDYDKKGSISTELQNEKIVSGNIERIKLVNSSKFISSILSNNKDISIILKLDCEGSEYGIIEDLAKNDLLQKISVLLIEFHYKGPNRIIDILNENRFNSICLSQKSEYGMIYSCKSG